MVRIGIFISGVFLFILVKFGYIILIGLYFSMVICINEVVIVWVCKVTGKRLFLEIGENRKVCCIN